MPPMPPSLPAGAIVHPIADAIRLQRSGHPDAAETLLRNILSVDGSNEEAWLRLGGIALGDGRNRLAARCFARVMLFAPDRAQAMHNLAEALRMTGRKAQATLAFTRALRLRPAYPKALAAFGLMMKDTGNGRTARHLAARALILDPAFATGWRNLATMFQPMNQPDTVARLLRRAALSDPGDTGLLAAYGIALCEIKETRLALDALRQAVALAPGLANTMNHLAFGLMQAGDLEGALRTTRRCRRIDPMAAEADAQDSLTWMMKGEFARGGGAIRRALILDPGSPGILINLALLLHARNQGGESIRWNRRALRLDPDSTVARFNLSMTLLQRGDFARGWALYEARWSMWGAGYPHHAPAWDGTPLNGRSILLTAEQGHGDTLHFVRYATLLAERGGRVFLHVQPLLKRLLANTPGVTAAHGMDEEPPACDLCAPLLSLPRLVGTRLDSIPDAMPYLRASEGDRPSWRERLAGERRLKVGLVWAGEPRKGDLKANSVDRRRSLTLDALAPLAAIPNIAFYSLQIGEAGAQAKAPPAGMEVIDWTGHIRDFADTAAFIDELDLVVTVDTSVCHLAGGLGKPVWVLSRFDACWRWLGHREDSPWYPTMRLFYQEEPGAWEAPITRLAAALAKRVSGGDDSGTGTRRVAEHASDLPGAGLAAAVAAHRSGRLTEAAAGYRRALAADPAKGDALHLLGLTGLAGGDQGGSRDGAERWLGRAVAVEPGRAVFRNSLGECQRSADRVEAAGRSYRQAVALDPAYAEPWVNLAKLSVAAGRPGDGDRQARRGVRLSPLLPDAWRTLGHAALERGEAGLAGRAGRRGLALRPTDGEALGHAARSAGQRGDRELAERLLGRVLRLDPEAVQAWRERADLTLKGGAHAKALPMLQRALALAPDFPEALNNLGGALLGLRRQEEAGRHYRRAIQLRPGYPDPWNNAGSALQERGDTAMALDHYRRAVALSPAHPAAYANMGETIRSSASGLADFRVAEALCRRALTLVPGHGAALNALSVLCLDLRRLEEAEAGFRTLIERNPESAQAGFNLSLVLLTSGRLREGWEHYEERWRIGEIPVPKAPGRLWTGEPLEGRSILLHAEQGHGDTLQFVRYAPMVAERGGRVHLAVHNGLRRLMERIPGLEGVYDLYGRLPATEVHCPLLSLPRAFETELGSIPAAVPYLNSDPAEVERWRARLPADGRFKVGLVWSGDPRPHSPKANAVDRRRSLTLAALAPLAAAGDILFVSLQKGTPAAQAKEPPPGMALIDPMDAVTDFADTAALMRCLDLIVTVDTSVAHLAGGLGLPVWVLSRFNGCWRWLDHRTDSPWYPTLRLFHQPAPGDWEPAVAQLAGALAEWLRSRAAHPF
ncbi:tetratricopeptide repeat protein (plasmid) [Azospirillum brasilense]|uniref:Tetratricopeptide repeat protein n=3 Tax=Azospirillum brasilense TaxID=192 RepID=A0A4D8R5Y2_AZOBR|nr:MULTISPECIES: tetratricopeptide repeat protein [Azospirillum]MDW7556751.1 tetratricopeptide repeat protein [Azospirillum brasilense]MDW7596920.1 tetratricopeptide repeat protein [Azospirillum brasilense]MDW7631425.1 tetratricopeptide repeat protein [Azospirillum brasilense]MDX5949899.1 tetratricopeptide repeat protein [Azospirillum brasilense]QCO12702.1 tetratricopeptide repeat protein [Azospirillum brasilense]